MTQFDKGLDGLEQTKDKNYTDIDSKIPCSEDCRRMFEKGQLRKGMSIEECIKLLCDH